MEKIAPNALPKWLLPNLTFIFYFKHIFKEAYLGIKSLKYFYYFQCIDMLKVQNISYFCKVTTLTVNNTIRNNVNDL